MYNTVEGHDVPRNVFNYDSDLRRHLVSPMVRTLHKHNIKLYYYYLLYSRQREPTLAYCSYVRILSINWRSVRIATASTKTVNKTNYCDIIVLLSELR